jgi:hypothetical protein
MESEEILRLRITGPWFLSRNIIRVKGPMPVLPNQTSRFPAQINIPELIHIAYEIELNQATKIKRRVNIPKGKT